MKKSYILTLAFFSLLFSIQCFAQRNQIVEVKSLFPSKYRKSLQENLILSKKNKIVSDTIDQSEFVENFQVKFKIKDSFYNVFPPQNICLTYLNQNKQDSTLCISSSTSINLFKYSNENGVVYKFSDKHKIEYFFSIKAVVRNNESDKFDISLYQSFYILTECLN